MVFDELGNKVKVVVFRHHVPHHFPAVPAAVENLEPFFLVLFDVDGFHEPETRT
jgi:hypothetical protein